MEMWYNKSQVKRNEKHMYIEMVDETGQVSKKCCNKPKKFWNLQPKN